MPLTPMKAEPDSSDKQFGLFGLQYIKVHLRKNDLVKLLIITTFIMSILQHSNRIISRRVVLVIV